MTPTASTRWGCRCATISEPMSRSLRWLSLLLLPLCLSACSGLLFMPMKTLVRTPADVGLAWRDVSLRAADGTALDAWWLPAVGQARGTVLFLHGNAENISTHLASVYWLPAAGYQVLLLDYRGFGDSAGKPRIPEVLEDVRAAVDWLVAQPGSHGQPLFLLGQSLGASLGGYLVGTDPAVRSHFAGIVLDSGFARYRWIAREVASRSWLTWPLQWFAGWSMPDGYDLLDHVGNISPVPLLMMHSRDDQIVGYHHALALYKAARAPRCLVTYTGPHISGFEDAHIRETVLGFFADPMGHCPSR